MPVGAGRPSSAIAPPSGRHVQTTEVGGGRRLLDDRVPRAALAAPTGPPRRCHLALGAAVEGLQLRHRPDRTDGVCQFRRTLLITRTTSASPATSAIERKTIRRVSSCEPVADSAARSPSVGRHTAPLPALVGALADTDPGAAPRPGS